MEAATIENVMAMKYILKIFKLLSALKVNYNNSCFMRINTKNDTLQSMASILGYEIGEEPFTYLGIKVGASHKKVAEWSYIIQKFRKKLIPWGRSDTFELGAHIDVHLPIIFLSDSE